MRCIVLICGYEKAYLDILSYRLMHSQKYAFDITYVTTEEFSKTLSQMAQWHLCLIDESFYHTLQSTISKDVKDKTVVLTEGMTGLIQHPGLIFKYQAFDVLEDLIYEQYLKISGLEKVGMNHKPTKVIGCYSPVGGAGNSTIAQVLARIKASRNCKVLHLSTELFPSHYGVYTGMNPHNFSDYLAYILKHSNWASGLDRMVSIDETSGIHYMKPHNHMLDMMELDPEQFEALMEHLKLHSGYDYIVIDYSTTTQSLFYQSSQHCDQFIFTVRKDYVGQLKWLAFSKAMETTDNNTMFKKSKCIGTELYGEQGSKMSNYGSAVEALSYDGDMPYDPTLFKNVNGRSELNMSAVAYRNLERLFNEI